MAIVMDRREAGSYAPRMSDATIVPPGGGEVIGDAPDRRVEILSDGDALHVTWSRFAAGRDGADLHFHRHHHDVFYVLAGELTLRLGVEDEAVRAPAGTFVCIPPLVVHGFRNASDAELRYLNLHAPGTGFADYMRGIRDGRPVAFDQYPPPAEGARPASEATIRTGGVQAGAMTVSETTCEPGDDVGSGYVLAGELAFSAGDGELRAEAGSWVNAPPGAARASAVGGPVRFLRVSGLPGG
jgi:quercetin dioxygenase-like cupin family protein